MEKEESIRLTSAEMTSLWQNYLVDSMSICLLNYFLAKVEDKEIRAILERAKEVADEHIEFVEEVFTKEKIPMPMGFSASDVDTTAPRLYQDEFFLYYMKIITKGAMATYSTILPNIVKKEIREFYTRCISSTTDLFNETVDLLTKNGLAIRPPYIPYERKVDYISKQSFLSGWFGEQRPLTGLEITNFYSNIQTATLVKALLTGLGQTTNSIEVRDYIERGIQIAKKQIEIFDKHLKRSDLPSPQTWDHEVTTSTTPPFSNKLIMFHLTTLSAAGIGNYGVSISVSKRRDIAAIYARFLTELGKYAEDGGNIMIDNGWMERPPHAANRDELTNANNE